MIFIFFLLILLAIIPFPTIGKNNTDYASKRQTKIIKGIFVAVVFICHYSSYVELSDNVLNKLFVVAIGLIGQLSVVMFLFYSGYGIYISTVGKKDYTKNFLKKRLLPVWLSFAIVICLFIIENFILGAKYGLKQNILAFTGWEAIGNSNWFMFVTFALYLAYYLIYAGLFKTKNDTIKLICFTVLCMGG